MAAVIKLHRILEDANIILNKNLLPYDDQSSKENPSGFASVSKI